MIQSFLIASAALLPLIAGNADGHAILAAARRGPGDPTLVEGSYRVQGEGPVGLWIPPGEALEFRVKVDLGLLGEPRAGSVSMSSGVEPFVSGLPRPGQSLAADGQFVSWARVAARGGYLGYELDHMILTRFLPQKWPSLISNEDNSGSRNRKREVMIGRKGGEWKSTYRGNSHCDGCSRREHFVEASLPWNKDYHCKGCHRAEHRLWNPVQERDIPAHTTDVLGAVYLARSLVRSSESELEFFMIQKENLWKVQLKKGELLDIKVPAGIFRCREVLLNATQPPGEGETKPEFSGLFGIKGELKLWFHEGTGVPVQIEGDVPIAGILDLHAQIELSKFRGTPEAFKPLP